MKYYLIENENNHGKLRKNGKHGWYYPTRKKGIQGIVIHTAEGAPAENVAKYFTFNTRPASAHAVVDESIIINLLPDTAVAFHVRGNNSKTLGLEIAYWAHKWGENLQLEDMLLNNAAKWCRKKALEHDIPITRLNKSSWAKGQKGFMAHSDLDPSRRTDPGDEFPWDKFLSYVAGEKPEFKRQAPPWCGKIFKFSVPLTKGSEIAQWQDAVGGLVADGLYGKMSVARCKEVQREVGLVPDGIVGPQTWYATFQLPKRGN
jgi:hypothetical protein